MTEFSKRSREGYLIIDHRASPGIPTDMPRSLGINAPGVPEGKVFETRTQTCSHCRNAVVMNMDRTRERGHCYKCDHYICDHCALELKISGECQTYEQRRMKEIFG